MALVPILHITLVLSFLGVTAILLVATLVQRFRIHDVVMSWPKFSIVSVWPITFVGVIGLLSLYAYNTSTTVPAWVFAGYVGGGVMWFVGAVLGTCAVVSRHGLVSGFGRSESAVPWVQVTDYFEVPVSNSASTRGRTQFVFLYRGSDGSQGRLEIPVPHVLVERFRFVVNERLDHKRPSASEYVPGRRATS
ncbi:MAG: hypothetical protein ACI80V_002764 [Rhodothermales bacterium]|jgi:hypothetical protein